MDKTHLSLIVAVVFSNDGMETLKNVLSKFADHGLQIKKTSSVYKVLGNPQKIEYVHDLKRTDHYFGLSVSFIVKSSLSADQQLSKLEELEAGYVSSLQKRALSLNLLFFDRDTKMTPGLSIPYPDFHNRAEFVIPAAEVWGDYVHPILNEELSSLTSRFVGESWGEFYAQGSELGLASLKD